ncbi:tRNA lysidine(34) synthetase TilS [Glycomyces sp. TRM65418]|uniref:tRNA lysidine(34) synthetase TilS n=1 Tax=Glycomyces sp. TRM65418 TaxID=2867006 RepID=UPI001CE5B485|nr:tRNA lysidine(34) synthetase TilS [Glycomyces sp. TRM65418]MCC3762541.1 tRNA lysidine(34) synthetase TilS [Glycomyces sp. TRM65418]QZD56580.1 tRNA lysidine(34) synthetase TilS [Glycomyces sp. TRM65418]
MAKLPPPVARLRVAVQSGLADLPPGALVLVACSGGPDSLALADTLAFCAPRMGLRAGLVTVDHGLQDDSAERAAEVASWAASAGFEPAAALTVEVGLDGGPEAAARTARYAALDEAAQRYGASAILLGHTRDDQAETALLALARGGGPRGVAGMRAVRGIYRRPLLGIARTDTHAACAERGLKPWADPHNTDPRYLRSALRPAIDVLVETLGEGLVANLARTAALIAADTDYLDGLAGEALEACRVAGGLDAQRLAALAAPIRQRALRAWALESGVSGAELNHRHLDAVDALVARWRGQGPTFLPGGIEVRREGGRLTAVTL